MTKCRPSKWVPWAILGAGLPWLAATMLNTDGLKADVVTRAMTALSANESTTWALLDTDGRDATLSGTAPSQAAVDAAVAAVAGTYGVRTVANAVQIVEPPKVVAEAAPAVVEPLPAPTVETYMGNSATPTFKGTWPEGKAASLSVKVGETAYTLGANPELTSDGAGNWQLVPSMPLPEGTLEVIPSVTDAAGTVTLAVAAAKAMVDLTPPAATTMAAAPAGAVWPYPITGTWAEGDATSMTATLNGRTYAMNRGAALTSDGKGTFTFAPAAKLAPGSYDIDFISNDGAGNATTAKTTIVVAEAAAATPTPAAPVPLTLTVNEAAAGSVWPYGITGSWSEGAAKDLTATLNGRTYVLNRGAALTSDGKGTFTFAPSAKLAPGSYDIEFASHDAADAVVMAKSTITVPEPTAVPAPVPAPMAGMPAPTVTAQLALTGAPVIKGTWPEGQATALTVGLGTKTYTLGKDANLQSRAGNWSLLPAASLKDGLYDVVVDATDATGTTRRDETLAELEIDGDQPAAPTVVVASADKSPEAITGTWDEAGAKTLKVMVTEANITAELGAANSPLTSDGGTWTLKLPQALNAGTYNVVAQSSDIRGRVQEDGTAGEIVVTGTPMAAAPAYDCATVLQRIHNVFPIRFGFDLSSLESPYNLSAMQYAALLKDPRCTTLKVEIAGHADDRGSEQYNQMLSEARAKTVMTALSEAGVDAARLSVKGYSDLSPIDPAETDEARQKNRRVEITVMK